MTLSLNDSALLKTQCLINGQWLSGDKTFPVNNPVNGTLIATVPYFGERETLAAIDAAESAFGSWSKKTAKERSEIIEKWYDLVIEHKSDLAKLLLSLIHI